MKGTHEQNELTKALDPLQEALVTKMIDDRFRSLSKEIEKEIKKLEVIDNPFMTSTRIAMNGVILGIKSELMK